MSRSQKSAPVFVIPPQVMLQYEDLNPVLYNPRSITPRKYAALKAGIKKRGFLQSLVVQKSTNAILGGNQRYKAVGELCDEAGAPRPALPCVVLDVDDRAAREINIALNNVGGDFDEKILGEVLQDIYRAEPIVEADALVMGFEHVGEIGVLIGGEDGAVLQAMVEGASIVADGTGPMASTKSPSLHLDFLDKAQRDAVKAAIVAKTKKDELSGVALARMLGIRPAKK